MEPPGAPAGLASLYLGASRRRFAWPARPVTGAVAAEEHDVPFFLEDALQQVIALRPERPLEFMKQYFRRCAGPRVARRRRCSPRR